MVLLVLQNLSDIGILIEILGFVFILLFWRTPTYSNLLRWKKLQKPYKFIFGEKKYQKRISDNTPMHDDDEITRTTGMALEGDNQVPKEFLRFWKTMKTLSFILVIIGLILQLQFLQKILQLLGYTSG